MSIPVDAVTAETPCPERLGGALHHYPFTRHGRPVTMPGPDDHGFGGTARTVLIGLCTSARKPVYLVPPRSMPDPANPPSLCPECLYERFLDLRRVKEGQLVAAAP